MALAPLMIRWGPDASSDLLRRSARCTFAASERALKPHRVGVSHESGRLVPRPMFAGRPRRALFRSEHYQKIGHRSVPSGISSKACGVCGEPIGTTTLANVFYSHPRQNRGPDGTPDICEDARG